MHTIIAHVTPLVSYLSDETHLQRYSKQMAKHDYLVKGVSRRRYTNLSSLKRYMSYQVCIWWGTTLFQRNAHAAFIMENPSHHSSCKSN